MFRFRKSKMLCLAGFTPVAKVDQATGERAGKVVRRREYDPLSLSRARLGSLPSDMNFSVSLGSRPSRPRKTIFFTFALRKPSDLSRMRQAMRKGQARSEPMLRKNPASRLRNEPKKANPA